GFRQFLAEGHSTIEVATIVADSPEGRNAQVQHYYESFLDRSAGLGEVQAWAGAVEQGLSEDVVVASFLGSAEYFNQFIRSDTEIPSQMAQSVPGPAGQRVSATFTITSRSTVYDNEFGIFIVDDDCGRVGDLEPGDPGYSAAALAAGRKHVLFTANKELGSATVELTAGSLF